MLKKVSRAKIDEPEDSVGRELSVSSSMWSTLSSFLGHGSDSLPR